MRHLFLPIAIVSALFGRIYAAEEWADRRLPVTSGVTLWLEAARQNAARAAEKRGTLEDGALFDVWYDGSGKARHLVQRVQSSQPKFHSAGSAAVIRFDGVDDHLSLSGLGQELKEFTAFIVASPRENPGFFRGFLAINETGKNDYLTGFTIDQSGQPTSEFSAVNIEGRGFQGAVNQMRQKHAFGGFHVITASAAATGDQAIKLFIGGEAQAARKRDGGPLKMDEITLGARFYSNDSDPPRVSGFLRGDFAEVILFDRALSDDERGKVETYLRDKHDALLRLRPGDPLTALAKPAIGVALKKERPGGDASSAPPVQMFVPGFTVRELPVKLTNINNLRYRHDGKLFALGYDGRIHLLTDSDGDGLEDRSAIFWDKGGIRAPIGMALTPPGYAHGTGVFVTSKGKVSLFVDTDSDDKADKEIVLATWKEGWHGVDGVGLALGADGSIYFGIGCANFANPYLTDKEGNNPQYDLKSDFGTIQRISPDFKKRETVCTGVRFSIGLAFNREGDLFATDQEGATWLPDGNPLDELLHIKPGKHYGFPPRHPKHLPNVIDEPAVELYGPQHQSTCGFVFNEHFPAEHYKDWKHFGPPHWKGDALVTGESRGKIYRTTLTKTPGGYTAKSSLIAGLGMLTVDVCVSPKGEMLVACHSGPPDWGTGPAGAGRIFKVTYSDPAAPQPLAIGLRSPVDLRIEFDKPLDPKSLATVAKQAEITYGAFVRAGDRFEQLKPPYEVVKQQDATPRFALPVAGASLEEGNRVLVLHTAPHPVRSWYALKLPGVAKTVIDLDYSLLDAKQPWVPDRTPASLVTPAALDAPAPAATGNWLRGQRIYVEEAKCATCHQVRGVGRAVGPDLSNLAHRDVVSITRDIFEPSATINPDHVTYTVTLKDGSELTGVLRTEPNGKLRIIDSAGKDTAIDRADVTEFRASALSTMPTGYDKLLAGEKMNDLLAFLRSDPPSMPRDLEGAPAARSRTEVEAVLAGAPEARPASGRLKDLRIILVAGRKDHGKGEHDYPAWQKVWTRLLAMADEVKVENAWEFPSDEQMKSADALVFYQQGTWTKERAAAIDAFLARGGGITYIHYAVDGGKEGPEFAKRIGLAWVGGRSKFRHGPLQLVFSNDSKHPVARNFSKLNLHDESYWQLTGEADKIQLLASGDEDGKPQPLFWTYEKDGGRVFVSIPGHYSWTFDDPLFRVLLLRGIAWSARQPVDRFNELAWPGASVKE